MACLLQQDREQDLHVIIQLMLMMPMMPMAQRAQHGSGPLQSLFRTLLDAAGGRWNENVADVCWCCCVC